MRLIEPNGIVNVLYHCTSNNHMIFRVFVLHVNHVNGQMKLDELIYSKTNEKCRKNDFLPHCQEFLLTFSVWFLKN